MTDDEQKTAEQRIMAGWSALTQACRLQHPKGPGGAAMCACGAACGGSEACSMLRDVRDLIIGLNASVQPSWTGEKLALFQRAIY